MKLYCGIDIHKNSYSGCILEEDGSLVRQHSFPSTKEGIEKFICRIPSSQLTVAIEACGIWRGVYNQLTQLGYNVKLGNPLKTHQIACKKKTDKVDARILADLLRTNYLPEVYIPDEHILELRDLVRHKSNVTRFKVRIQNKIKGYLLREGIKYPKRLWNKPALDNLTNLEKLELNDFIQTYWHLRDKENEVLRRIRAISQNTRLTKILMTHPGIGDFGSLMMFAEIADINRFESTKQLIAYGGLCPGIYQSGDKSHTVRNHAVNKWLKWIVTECSGRAAMLDPSYMKLYSKVKKKKGFKIARKMLRTVYHMLKNEEPYHAS